MISRHLIVYRLLSPKIFDFSAPLRRISNSVRPEHDHSTTAEGTPSMSKAGGTVDENESRKFAQLCYEWWDENGSLKALHSMNRVRVPWIKRTLFYKNVEKREEKTSDSIFPLKNLHILDVGCGGGLLCEPLARLGATVTGVDAVEENVQIAKAHSTLQSKINPNDANLNLNLTYLTFTVEQLRDQEFSKFDAVIASEVLEHVSDRELFLKSCVDLLKTDGFLFITTLNRTLLSQFFGIYLAENILNIVPKGIHDWEKFTEPETLKNLLQNYNCSTRLIHGLQYNPLTNRWAWSRDRSINYALCAIKN